MSTPSSLYSLPLFPLHEVLFPMIPIQLNIFEDRYLELISNCIEKELHFGVVLIKEGEEVGNPAVPHEIGCTARVLTSKQLPNGNLRILAVGLDRFRILEYSVASTPYLEARVETYDDNPIGDLEEEQMQALKEEVDNLFREYVLRTKHVPVDAFEMLNECDPTTYGLFLSGFIQIELNIKQKLLEYTNPLKRLELVRNILKVRKVHSALNPEVNPMELFTIPKMVEANEIDPENNKVQEWLRDFRN